MSRAKRSPGRTMISIRLEAELLERIDAYALALRDATPGVSVSRADALRVLLLDALSRGDKKRP